MMTNLFSTFDPATSLNFSINWMSTFIGIMIIPSMYWITPSRMSFLFKMMFINLYNEFKTLLGEKSQGFNMMIISLFMFILLNNMMGLLPYIFTSSSHLSYTLSLALPLWMSMMIFGWLNKTQEMFAHMIPNGTPPILMPFMVLIETISNLIRPGSLAVRLTANMIAGHLLMSLLGNNMTESSTLIMPLILMVQIILMMFETAVSIIQAYVFSVLTTLYSSEVNYV
uniref:ATP synthase subunit a n=1 Tax=Pygovepres vaccinicola TaxID=981301 RepID=A0A514LPI5_9HEMI|nr:ATP synthase F0 subunit 6 [Pygovepres vaccinicola]QDI93522.1 ATP synthase F0 subunit 6 [Pygovepres vaccinicola]QDI93535.1 ATP synthase F0 subunit 6 [Pygovepres vaccinicola]